MGITSSRTIRAPRGTTLTCKGWPQEAAMRMLMNNLDPEVAERPEDLVVYGGSGRAARDWPSFEALVASLRALDHDETLVVQSGKPVAVFRTHPDAPRVLIANALVVPAWANWTYFRELEGRGLITRKPSGELGGHVTLGLGNYNSRNLQIGLDLPAFELGTLGTISARLSGRYRSGRLG